MYFLSINKTENNHQVLLCSEKEVCRFQDETLNGLDFLTHKEKVKDYVSDTDFHVFQFKSYFDLVDYIRKTLNVNYQKAKNHINSIKVYG